jgi:hypothetical protein
MQLCNISHPEVAFTCVNCPVCEAIQEKNDAEEAAEELRTKINDLKDVVDLQSEAYDKLAAAMEDASKENDKLQLRVQELEDKYVDKQAE